MLLEVLCGVLVTLLAGTSFALTAWYSTNPRDLLLSAALLTLGLLHIIEAFR